MATMDDPTAIDLAEALCKLGSDSGLVPEKVHSCIARLLGMAKGQAGPGNDSVLKARIGDEKKAHAETKGLLAAAEAKLAEFQAQAAEAKRAARAVETAPVRAVKS